MKSFIRSISIRVGTSASAALAVAIGIPAMQAKAGDIIKADNTTALDAGGSWTGGTAPTLTDFAVWSGTYNTAGSLGAALPGSAISWQGIKVGALSGTAAGLVSIGGTGNAVAGSNLTIDSGGLDLSGANQNLVINSATTVIAGAAQTWNVASGRNVRFGTTGTGGANANLDGAAGTVITVTGGGLIDLNQGGTTTGFADAAGFGGFNGKWIIDSGTTLRGLRHGATAFGTNTDADAILLKGGTLATGGITGAVGNWAWTTPISLSAATNSIIDNQNISGSARWLKLGGAISGSGNLSFASTGVGTMSVDTGFILASANTLSGTVTIGSGVFVRLGGLTGTDVTTAVGPAGDLGTATVVNNGTLTLSRNNTWTFANNVSGSGVLRIGIATGSATHIVTVSGNNTHTGGTTLQTAVTMNIGSATALGTGPLTIAGNGIFDNVTGAPLILTNALTMSGGSPTFTGSNPVTFNGAVSIAGANRTMTVNGSTLTLAGNITEDAALRNFTKAGAGTLVLSGTNSYTGTTAVSGGTLTLSGGAAIADTGAVTLSNTAGAALVLNSSETIGNLSGGGANGGNVSIGANALTINSAAGVQLFSGVLSGTGPITKAGAGSFTLDGANTYSGAISVTAGALAFRGVNSEDGAPSVQLATGTELALGSGFVGQTATIGGLSGAGTVSPQFDATVGTKTLEVSQSGDSEFSGVMRDASDASGRILALTKSGNGKLTLSGINTFTGATIVNAGTLLVTGSLSGSSAVTVNGGTLGGSGTVGAVTVGALGTIAPGTSPGILSTGDVTFNGGTLALEIGGTTAGTDYDQLNVTGAVSLGTNSPLTISLGSFNPVDGVDVFTIINNDLGDAANITGGLFTYSGTPLAEGALFTVGAQDFAISYVGGDGNDVVLSAVPEPASVAMLLCGFAVLGMRRRRSAC